MYKTKFIIGDLVHKPLSLNKDVGIICSVEIYSRDLNSHLYGIEWADESVSKVPGGLLEKIDNMKKNKILGFFHKDEASNKSFKPYGNTDI